MSGSSRRFVYILLFTIGVVLLVGGIAAGKPGAWIIGLIVGAVNFQLWQRSRSGLDEEKTNG
mgnify:CR=1 FL=1